MMVDGYYFQSCSVILHAKAIAMWLWNLLGNLFVITCIFFICLVFRYLFTLQVRRDLLDGR